MTNDRDTARRRARLLAETAKTYDTYLTSGYANRWRDQPIGMLRAIQERDTWVASALQPALPGLIVDLGTGDGALGLVLEALGSKPMRFLGVDILDSRLERARERVPWGEFSHASADAVPSEDGTASAVVAMTLLSSLTEGWFRERVAVEVARLLEPGGRFVVYDIRYRSPSNQSVVPIPMSELRRLFVGWQIQARSMTLLPPLARSRLVGNGRRYSGLHAIPWLRSHLGAILTKPTP